jgi:hypothetical protein
MAWCDDAVHLGEWDVAEARWLRAFVVRRPATCPTVLHLARSSEGRLVLAFDDGAGASVIVFQRSARNVFAETGAMRFEEAFAPSLDADDHVIAFGAYERRAPLLHVSPTSDIGPPEHVLHVRLLDPATLRVVSARVFQGSHLLRPHAVAQQAGQALRLLGGRLFVALPDDDPHLLTLRLPALTTEKERIFVIPSALRWPGASSIVLNRLGEHLLIGVGETFVLGAALETVGRHHTSITRPIAFDHASRLALATDGDPVTLDGYRVRVFKDPSGASSRTLLFAHGRGIIIDASGAAARIEIVD